MISISEETTSILHWLCRDYESAEFWKTQARKCYLETITHPNGDADSEKALVRFSKQMKTLLRYFRPTESFASVWESDRELVEGEKILQRKQAGSGAILLKQVPVPDYESGSIDWVYVADYFLRSASVPWPEFEAINTSRTAFNDSLAARESANEDRVRLDKEAVCLYLKEWSCDLLSTGVLLPKGVPECPTKDKWTGKGTERKSPREMFKLMKLTTTIANYSSLKLPLITLYKHQ